MVLGVIVKLRIICSLSSDMHLVHGTLRDHSAASVLLRADHAVRGRLTTSARDRRRALVHKVCLYIRKLLVVATRLAQRQLLLVQSLVRSIGRDLLIRLDLV